MKYFLTLVFVSIIVSLNAQQESKDYIRFKEDMRFAIGSVTDLKGNKIEGLVEKLEFDSPYNKVVFVSPTSEKKVFRPSELKGYEILHTKFESNKFSFLELVSEEDRIEMFKKIVMRNRNGQSSIVFKKNEDMVQAVFFVKKKDTDKFARLSEFGFIGKSYKMISDCKALVKDIKYGRVDRKSVDEIVYRYNKCK